MAAIELAGSGGRGFASLTGAAISIGGGGAAPTLAGFVVGKDDPALTYFGGFRAPLSAGAGYDTLFNLTLANGSRTGVGGRLAFETDGTAFELRLPGTGASLQAGIFVDGLRLALPAITLPADGQTHYVQVDLAGIGLAPGWHRIEIEYYNGGTFGDVVLAPGAAIRSTTDFGPRMVFMGDSFTEGTGASAPQNDYASLVGHALGTPDIWQSAFGGTGYAKPLGTRPGLADRIVADGVEAQGDIYVIAMGINDSGDISDAVRETLEALTEGVPNAKIFVLGPWNAWNPAPVGAPDITAQIAQISAEFPQIVFLDAGKVAFTKADNTHPDDAGHLTLARWLTAEIEEHLGIDGGIYRGLAGDVVGPVFFSDFDPGETYTYQVLEGGVLSTRFELVADGAFPILKLIDGMAANDPGPVTVTVRITDGQGGLFEQAISIEVRASTFGTALDDSLAAGADAALLSGGEGNDALLGSTGDDRLLGGAGADTLSGNGGSDTMIGGAGDDAYLIDSSDDLVREQAGGGHDTVRTTMLTTYLADEVEDLVLEVEARHGTGNDLANHVIGNDAINRLYGLAGDDLLVGLAGDDQLDGGLGADLLHGGLGNDAYRVDRLDDVIFELPGEGNDAVLSASSYYLYAGVENLSLLNAAGDAFGVGNDLANTINGNDGTNLLIGGDGNDTLGGGNGNDVLYGEDGDDNLGGGAGIDYLFGGAGNDTINGSSGPDVLHGEDGNDSLNGGTSFDTDILVGGAGRDTLNAISGQLDPDYDLLYGGTEDDSYWVDTGDDLTFEDPNGGNDYVYADIKVPGAGVYLYANVEGLVLRGTTAFGVGNELRNYIEGSASANWLLGGDGGDTINGKAGDDVLFGEGGADTFVFEAGTGADVIGDFQQGSDKIRLQGYGLDFTALGQLFVQDGAVGAIRFANGDLIVLHGVTMASLTAADFIFA